MTAFNSKTGGFHLTTVGRVQTPTLAIVVERERKIREFKPRSYWEVEADFAAKAGNYAGKWFDEGYKGKEDDEHARADRLWEQNKAEAIRAATLGKPGIVSEEAKPETRLSPLLFDLLRNSQDFARRTAGRFDPTLGPLTRLWRETRRTGKLPSPESLNAAKAACGWTLLELDPSTQTLTLKSPGMRLDLGAIGKGFAADEMLRTLRDNPVLDQRVAVLRPFMRGEEWRVLWMPEVTVGMLPRLEYIMSNPLEESAS
jgi:hypothetical protein